MLCCTTHYYMIIIRFLAFFVLFLLYRILNYNTMYCIVLL